MDKIKFTTVGQLKAELEKFSEDLPIVFRYHEDCFIEPSLSKTKIDFMPDGADVTFYLEHDEPEEVVSSVDGVLMDFDW